MSSRTTGREGIGTLAGTRQVRRNGDIKLSHPSSSRSNTEKSKDDIDVVPRTHSSRSIELSKEEKQLHDEFKSAETYLRNFLAERDVYQVVISRKKLISMVNTLHAAGFELMTTSIHAFRQLNIIHRLWTVSIYQIVTLGRQVTTKDPSKKSEIQKVVNLFLEKGVKYLEELGDAMKAKYPFSRSLIHGGADYSAYSPAEADAAASLLPRLLIFRGDSLRYLNLLSPSLEAYEQARSIDPGNGRAYHQMGLMALLQRDFLSAVYDFLRAYTSPNPDSLDGVKSQIQLTFTEARKAYDKVGPSFWYKAGKKAESRARDDVAREIWVFPHEFQKVPQFPEALDTKQSHLEKLSPKELSRRFCLTYVLMIEKLWTNSGMDTIHIVAEESLVYLEGIFQRGIIFLPLRIIQVLSINMLLLDKLRPLGSSDLTWLTAIQYSMEVFIILTERLGKLVDLCDWDCSQLETIAVGLSTWIHWMEKYPKDWTQRRPRPVFSIKYVTRRKDELLANRLDDGWTSFASLMTKLAVIFQRFSSPLFPSVASKEDDEHKVPLAPFPEAHHLFGLLPMATSSIFRPKYFCGNKRRLTKARNYIRLKTIFRFGARFLDEKYGILEVNRLENGTHEFFTRVKVKGPHSETEVGGLATFHHHYWLQSFTSHQEQGQRRQSPKSGDVNNASRTIVRRPKSPVESSTVAAPIPQTVLSHKRNLKIWESFAEEGFRTDIIVEPINFVLDTNCFVRRLGMIKVLMGLTTNPLIIPVAVILELKGLGKGGLRKKDQVRYGGDLRNAVAQQKMIDGMALAEKCQAALAYIAENINYFRIITSTATVLRIKTPHAFVRDDYFDPSDSNDNRILLSCRWLEDLDYASREKDTTRQIHRRTVLLTGDRGLRIRSSHSYHIPSRAITPIAVWLLCHHYPKFYGMMTSVLEEVRRRQYLRRRQRRADRKALRNPPPPQPTVLRILQPTECE